MSSIRRLSMVLLLMGSAAVGAVEAQTVTPLTIRPAAKTPRIQEPREPQAPEDPRKAADIESALADTEDSLESLDQLLAATCNRVFLFESPETGAKEDRATARTTLALAPLYDDLASAQRTVDDRLAVLLPLDAANAQVLALRVRNALPRWERSVLPDQGEAAAPPDVNRRKALAVLATCAARIDVEVSETEEEQKGEVPSQLHYRLIQQHFSYKRVKNWLEHLGSSNSGRSDERLGYIPREDVTARDAVRTLDQNVHRRLRRHDLLQTFSAALMSGPVFADSGQPSEETSKEEGSRAQALSHIVFQSKHWGDESQTTWDASIVGKFGLQPVLTVVKPAQQESSGEASTDDGTAEAEPKLTTVHDRALHWNLGGALNRGVQETAEMSGVFRIGGSYLVDDRLLVDRVDSGSYIAAPIRNENGRTAWMWEAAIEYNLFDDPLEIMHVLQGFVSPKFHVSTGFRRDSRFDRSGDLATFDSPEQRWFFKFFLDTVKVVDQRKLGEKQPTFNFGFGVEYERAAWWAKGKTLPGATRVFIRGDVNLLRAFKGEESGAKDNGSETKSDPAAPRTPPSGQR